MMHMVRNFIFFAQNVSHKMYHMRKGLLLSGIVVVLALGSVSVVSAQKLRPRSAEGTSYRNAIGMGIDFGDGLTLVGVSGKHFFSENNVGVGEILFGDHAAIIQAFYQYHREIEGVESLRWFAGIGPSLALYSHSSDFAIRPIGGIDYKIPAIPLSFSFDWRPTFTVTHGGDVNPARFGLGARYAFNN
jgi:hypothetical protein